MKKTLLLLVITCFVSQILFAQSDIQKQLQTQFITVEDGGTITIPSGKYTLSKPLWLDGKKHVTIKGAGMDETVLSFKNQKEGAEGIKITNAENITLQDLSVQDTKGDAVKTQEVDKIQFIKVKTEWTGRAKKSNGAYGLYPVQCTNVLIDGCEAIGASDAGIYVGQSDNIIVRNSKVSRNVAGIEIENSTNADVYNNTAIGNTGGILVFDLPGLIKKKGGNVRVYKNLVKKNNFKNFAPAGNSVALVPPGTGILVLATSHVEIFDNDIIENKTFGTAIASYYFTEREIKDKEYDPYTTNIFIHDNRYSRKKQLPTLRSKMGLFALLKFGRKVPDIVVDGIFNEEYLDANGRLKEAYQICVKDNGEATFANFDAANGFDNLSRDPSNFTCQQKQLPPVELTFLDFPVK